MICSIRKPARASRFAVADHHETAPLRNRAYRGRLARRYYQAEGRAPSAQALQDALSVLEGQALYDGKRTPWRHASRAARAIYLDLANEEWEVVEVTADGWRVTRCSPVRFRRPNGIEPLPRPVRGDLEPLHELVNVEAPDWQLFVAWLLATLRPDGPFPILLFYGEQGSTKTTAARAGRRVVDPDRADLRAAPKNGHDLMIAASNAR